MPKNDKTLTAQGKMAVQAAGCSGNSKEQGQGKNRKSRENGWKDSGGTGAAGSARGVARSSIAAGYVRARARGENSAKGNTGGSRKGKFSFGRWVFPVLALLLLALVVTGCAAGGGSEKTAGSQNKPFVLGDASWDSIQVHNRIAGFIIEHGYGYKVDYLFGETLPLLQGLTTGDIDIYMEVWWDNFGDLWEETLEEGIVQDLGLIFPDAPQGWYVPTYMIKGDPERGIEATAPDLKSVFDLPQYKDLFIDEEVPNKGRFYNSPPGWVCTGINEEKFDAYELNDTFNLFGTGSDTALVTSMVNAYEKGEPWVGYYWEPTWVMGKLDMTLLEEPPHDPGIWETTRGCAYPAARVLKGINSDLRDEAPEVVEFIEKYETTLQQNNELLAYMIDHGGDTEKAARHFLEDYSSIWKKWVPEEIAAKVEKALSEVQ